MPATSRAAPAGEQFLSRFDFAFGYLPFAAAPTSELASDFETSAGALNGELPFHLGEAGHDVEKKRPEGVPVSSRR